MRDRVRRFTVGKQAREHECAAIVGVHAPSERGAMAQHAIDTFGDGRAILRAGEAVRPGPIAQIAVGRLGGGLETVQNFDRGLQACARRHTPGFSYFLRGEDSLSLGSEMRPSRLSATARARERATL